MYFSLKVIFEGGWGNHAQVMWSAAQQSFYKHATKTAHSSQHASSLLLRLHVQRACSLPGFLQRYLHSKEACVVVPEQYIQHSFFFFTSVRWNGKVKKRLEENVLYFAYSISVFLSSPSLRRPCTLSLAWAGFQCSVGEENDPGLAFCLFIMHYNFFLILACYFPFFFYF